MLLNYAFTLSGAYLLLMSLVHASEVSTRDGPGNLVESGLRYSSAFYANISIGTPPHSFQFAIDSAAADTWIVGVTGMCSFASDCTTPIFNSSESTTSVNKSTPVNIQNSLVSFNGYDFQETFSVEGVSVGGVDFVLATVGYSFILANTQLSGAVGLSPGSALLRSLSATTSTPFGFGLFLGSASTSDSVQGMLTCGGANPTLYTGALELHTRSTANSALWGLKLSGVKVGNKTIQLTKGFNVVFDTSAEIITGTTPEVTSIFEALGGNSQGVFPCNTTENLSFSFGGRFWDLPFSAMSLGPIEGEDSSKCATSFSAADSDNLLNVTNTWVIGWPFLTTVYTVFQESMIGFAELSTLAGGIGPPNATDPILNPLPSSTSMTHPAASSQPTSGSQPASAPQSSQMHHSPTAASVGGTVGGVMAVFVLIAVAIFLRRVRKQNARNLAEAREIQPEPYTGARLSFLRPPWAPLAWTGKHERSQLSPNGEGQVLPPVTKLWLADESVNTSSREQVSPLTGSPGDIVALASNVRAIYPEPSTSVAGRSMESPAPSNMLREILALREEVQLLSGSPPPSYHRN